MSKQSSVVAVVCLVFGLAVSATTQVPESVRVTAATASIRVDPKPTAAILTTVKSGTRLEVRGAEGDWYQIATFVGPVRIQGYVLKKSVVAEKPLAPPASNAPTATVARFGMSATVEVAGKPVPLTSTIARVGRLAARVETARAAALAMPIGAGAQLPDAPATPITYVWLIDEVNGARTLGAKPAIVVQFNDAPGISADDFVPAIVELVGTPSGPRVMSALRGRVDQSTRTVADWDIDQNLRQEAVKVTLDMTDRGVAKISPVADLKPGEYAVVMRPTGNKRFTGSSVLSLAADGRVFAIAWVFVVR